MEYRRNSGHASQIQAKNSSEQSCAASAADSASGPEAGGEEAALLCHRLSGLTVGL